MSVWVETVKLFINKFSEKQATGNKNESKVGMKLLLAHQPLSQIFISIIALIFKDMPK